MISQFTSLASRVLFVGSFLLAALAVLEKAVNVFGFTLLRTYAPWRILEFAAVMLLFVIALQLRELKERQGLSAGAKDAGSGP